jgi:hypothetical protein
MSGALGAVPRVGALSRCFLTASLRLDFDFAFELDFALDFELDLDFELELDFDPPALLRFSAICRQIIAAGGGPAAMTRHSADFGRPAPDTSRLSQRH